MRHHSGIFLPFLSHNSAAILLKKRQKPAQKHVSNILRKNFKQLLKIYNKSVIFAHIGIKHRLTVKGMQMTERTLHIDVGESGFMARVAAPVLAAVFKDAAANAGITIDGCGTLTLRPMSQLRDILSRFGLSCTDRMPLEIKGRLRPGKARLDGSGGSQAISGLMFALPLMDAPSEIIVDNPVSVPYIFLTRKILSEYGIDIRMVNDCKRLKIFIPAPQRYRALPLSADAPSAHDGDWSAAAVFICGAAVSGRCTVSGLAGDSLQADKAVLDALKAAGALVRDLGGAYTVMRSPLHRFDFDCTQCPDLLPALAAFAVYCEGTSVIKGMGRLSSKESDRAASICRMLSKASVGYRLQGDSIHIEGSSLTRRLLERKMPSPGVYDTFDDHRMVMAVMLLGLPCTGIRPDSYAPLAKSMPSFRNLWEQCFFPKI